MSLFKLSVTKISGRGTHLFGTATSVLFNGEGIYGLTADGTGSKFFYNLNTKNDKAGVVRVEVSESETSVWSDINRSFENKFITLTVYKEPIISSPTEDYTILAKNICFAYDCEFGAIVYIRQGTRLKRIITDEDIDDIIDDTMEAWPGGITITEAYIVPGDDNLLRMRFTGGLIDENTISGDSALPIVLSVTVDYVDVDLSGSSFYASLGGEYISVFLPEDITIGQLVYVHYDHTAGGGLGWNDGVDKYLEDFTNQLVTNNVTTTTTTTGTTLADFRVTSAEVTAWNNIRLQTTEDALYLSLETDEFIITQDDSPMAIASLSTGSGYIDITTWSFFAGTTVEVSYTGPSAQSTVGNPLEIFTDLLATNSLTTTTTTTSTSSTSTSSTSTSSTSSTSTSTTSTSSTSTSTTSTTTLADFRVTSGETTAWNNIRLYTTEMALYLSLETDEFIITHDGSPLAVASFSVQTTYIDITTWGFLAGEVILVSYIGPSAYSSGGNPLEVFSDLVVTNNMTTTSTTSTSTEAFDDEEIWTDGVDTFRLRIEDGYAYLDQEITPTGFEGDEETDWDYIWKKGDPITTTTTTTTTP